MNFDIEVESGSSADGDNLIHFMWSIRRRVLIGQYREPPGMSPIKSLISLDLYISGHFLVGDGGFKMLNPYYPR